MRQFLNDWRKVGTIYIHYLLCQRLNDWRKIGTIYIHCASTFFHWKLIQASFDSFEKHQNLGCRPTGVNKLFQSHKDYSKASCYNETLQCYNTHSKVHHPEAMDIQSMDSCRKSFFYWCRRFFLFYRVLKMFVSTL